MKLVVFGGSAHSTPNLFAHDPLRAMAGSIELVLIGRSRQRLDAVARAIEVLAQPESIRVACETLAAGSVARALRGADVVLCQARYGGYEARASDEAFPLKYGLCGDEGLGVGGLAAAWRAWPELCATLEDVRRVSPSARVILMTSPVGVLTRCALDAYPELRLAGICELPWTTLRDAGAAVGVDARDAAFEYAGVNHLGWFWNVRSWGRDVVAEYSAARLASRDFPSGELIERLGAIPLKYLRMHYEAASVLLDQRNLERPRARVLSELQQRAYDAYRTADAGAILDLLPQRPAPWYEHAIAPLIAGFAGVPTSIPFFLTVRNEGYAPTFNADDVLEIPHRFAGGDLAPVERVGKIPEHLCATLDSFVAYERMASKAVSDRDTAGLHSAVRIHPWVSDPGVAPLVVSEICG